MTSPSGGHFRVSTSALVLQQLQALSQIARRLGMLPQFLAAARFIYQQLQTDPLSWGDPNYRLRKLGLLLCQGVHRPLLVRYAVDEVQKIVYIKEFELLLGPAAGPP